MYENILFIKVLLVYVFNLFCIHHFWVVSQMRGERYFLVSFFRFMQLYIIVPLVKLNSSAS